MQKLIDRDKLIDLLMERFGIANSLQRSDYARGCVETIHAIIVDVIKFNAESPLETPQESTITFFSNGKEGQQIDISGLKDGKPHTFVCKDGQFHEVEKRCGTCVHYEGLKPNSTNIYSCALCWGKRRDASGIIEHVYSAMSETDGANCPDWQDKPKEKIRVWTCINCGKTLYMGKDYYMHQHNSNVYCDWKKEFRYENTAMPKPDSERWAET